MRIGVFGDIHDRVRNTAVRCINLFQNILETEEFDLVLQIGDMCYYPWSYSQTVYWIYGNNDLVKVIEEIESGRKQIKNLRNIKTGEVLHFYRDGESIKVAGLNGGYDPIYYTWSKDKLARVDPSYFVAEDVERCAELKDVDIFLTHEWPSGLGFRSQNSDDPGAPPLRELVDKISPRFLFCGHMHRYQEVHHNGVNIYCLDQLKEEYYILDTSTQELERVKSIEYLKRHPELPLF